VPRGRELSRRRITLPHVPPRVVKDKTVGLTGAWYVSLEFAGRERKLRFYGRDPICEDKDDAAALASLPDRERVGVVKAAHAVLDAAQLEDARRRAQDNRFRSGMRFMTGAALGSRPNQSAVSRAPHRPARRETRVRGGGVRRRIRARAGGSRGSPRLADEDPEPSSVSRRGSAMTTVVVLTPELRAWLLREVDRRTCRRLAEDKATALGRDRGLARLLNALEHVERAA
jgi:hypothetical protein